jgi:hypothetical protein
MKLHNNNIIIRWGKVKKNKRMCLDTHVNMHTYIIFKKVSLWDKTFSLYFYNGGLSIQVGVFTF